MNTPIYTPLVWETEYLEHDNTSHTAQSCAGDGEDCYRYEIIPALVGDKVVWIDNSDEELGRSETLFHSLEEAKADIEARDRMMWDNAEADGEIVSLREEEA